MVPWLQEIEKNELLQARDKELDEAQQHLKQQRKEVIMHHFVLCETRTIDIYVIVHMQEQSSRREIDDLQGLLLYSEELVDDFQKALQERDLELETLRPKVLLL